MRWKTRKQERKDSQFVYAVFHWRRNKMKSGGEGKKEEKEEKQVK